MSPALSAPPEPPPPRRVGPALSADPDVRSVQVGIVATIIIHLLLLLLVPAMFRNDPNNITPPTRANPQFNVELAPETFNQTKEPDPFKFVETNPDAPDNAPDKTTNFGAQNQQVAQEKPAPNDKNDRPAIEGEKDVQSTQIADGRLTQLNIPTVSAPPIPFSPETEAADAAKRAQDPLSGFDKTIGENPNSIGSYVAPKSEQATNVAERVEGLPDAPLVAYAAANVVNIDPKIPQPRPQLTKNVRPAIFQENKIGTSNIGLNAHNAKFNNYGRYLQQMIEAIQLRWDNLIASSRHYPQPGSKVAVTFVLDSAGLIASIRSVDGDAGDLATNWCVTAISPSQDFSYGPWTDDMIAVLGEQSELTFTFLYR